MDDIEIAFTRGRIVEVLGLLRRTFPTSKVNLIRSFPFGDGPRLILISLFPQIILQTPHIGAKSANHVFSPIRKFQQVCIFFLTLSPSLADVYLLPGSHQAQTMASISLETGIELFDWGRLVSSLSNEMADGLHFRTGAATWIWVSVLLDKQDEAYICQRVLTSLLDFLLFLQGEMVRSLVFVFSPSSQPYSHPFSLVHPLPGSLLPPRNRLHQSPTSTTSFHPSLLSNHPTGCNRFLLSAQTSVPQAMGQRTTTSQVGGRSREFGERYEVVVDLEWLEWSLSVASTSVCFFFLCAFLLARTLDF